MSGDHLYRCFIDMEEFKHIGSNCDNGKREDLLVRLGRRVKELRCGKSMSPSEFGDDIGHTAAFVLRLENGQVNVSFDTLGRCAKALDFEVTELLNI